jgi:hypothetical protein
MRDFKGEALANEHALRCHNVQYWVEADHTEREAL